MRYLVEQEWARTAEDVVWPTPRSASLYRRAGFGSESAPLSMDLAGD